MGTVDIDAIVEDRALFKGREDVFAKRWYSDVSKKSGYQPVCEREWNSELSATPKNIAKSGKTTP